MTSNPSCHSHPFADTEASECDGQPALEGLTDADSAALVGKRFTTRPDALSGCPGRRAVGETSGFGDGGVARVIPVRGSIAQSGQLRRDERLYVYDDTTFRTAPVVALAVGLYYLALLALAVPLTSKERGESGAADHGDLERES